MMKLVLSKQAREVCDYLYGLGVVVGPGEHEAFDLEVCCSQFFPNHIVAVIDQCLKGKKPGLRLMRAQSMGWRYFAGPVRSYLRGRALAHQPGRPDLGLMLVPWSHKVWSITTSSFLVHDMNRTEADTLIFSLPHLCDQETLVLALNACRDRGIRTVPYLHGVLTRDRAQRAAPIFERDRDEERPWAPGELEAVEERLGVEDWNERLATADSVRAMRNGKAQRR